MLRVLGVLFRWLLALLAILIAAFVTLAFFSESQATFRCEGELTSQGVTKPANLFITLTQYRWWVKFWSKSDGMLSIEAPKEGIAYEPYLGLDKVGDSVVHIFRDSDPLKDFKGGYYSLSRHLKLDSSHGFFEGDCVPVQKDL